MDFLKDQWLISLAGPCVLWVRKCKIEPWRGKIVIDLNVGLLFSCEKFLNWMCEMFVW